MPGIWLGDRVDSSSSCSALSQRCDCQVQYRRYAAYRVLRIATPAATLLCASVGMLAEVRGWVVSREMIVLLAVVVALLMVLPIRMFALKFSGFGWRGNEVRYLFLAFCVVAIAVLRPCSIPVIIVLYILISTARWIFRPEIRKNKPDSCMNRRLEKSSCSGCCRLQCLRRCMRSGSMPATSCGRSRKVAATTSTVRILMNRTRMTKTAGRTCRIRLKKKKRIRKTARILLFQRFHPALKQLQVEPAPRIQSGDIQPLDTTLTDWRIDTRSTARRRATSRRGHWTGFVAVQLFPASAGFRFQFRFALLRLRLHDGERTVLTTPNGRLSG